MRKWLIFLIIFATLITAGCRTTREIAAVLPPRPQRQEIEPTDFGEKSALYMLTYYEHLVREWESWGESVANIDGIRILENPSVNADDFP